METGGIAIAYKSDGSIHDHAANEVRKADGAVRKLGYGSNQRYAIADDVQVYLRKTVLTT